MGILTPKLNSVLFLNTKKLNIFQSIVAVFLLLGFSAFSASAKEKSFSVADPIITRTVSNTENCNSNPDYSMWLDLEGISQRFRSTSGTFVEYDDGTASLEMTVVNTSNSDLSFDLYVTFSDRTFDAPSGSPRENRCNDTNSSDWHYYTSMNGTATGTNGYQGAVFTLMRTGPAFQLGQGANNSDNTNRFGASGWFELSIVSEPNNNPLNIRINDGMRRGDLNFNLSGEPLQPCSNVDNGGEIAGPNPVCFEFNNPGLITSVSLPSGGSGDLEYLWLSSTSGCPTDLSQAINGANNFTFNPGPISQTTWYVRCSRRFGCTDWELGESNCVRIDYQESCGDPAPTGWTLNCEDDQSVEIIGEGIRCQNSYTLNIPNANDVVQIVAEVVYKGTTANPTQLMIKTNNELAIVPAEFTNPARAFYFRTTFGPASEVVLENIPNACNAQSLILYVFRQGGQTTASTGQFVQTWIYHDTHCETLEIPTAPATRDVEIEVPLSEITTDGRIAIVRAEVVDNPSINAEVIIDDVNQGDALYIAKLILRDVAPLEDEIQICVESPFPTSTTPDGQSLVYSGGCLLYTSPSPRD